MTNTSITIFACHNSTSDFAIILADKIGRYPTKAAADAVWAKAAASELFGAMQFVAPNYVCSGCRHQSHTDIADFTAIDLEQVISDEQAAFDARLAAYRSEQAAAGDIDWFSVIAE
jgi:hypothetical protein